MDFVNDNKDIMDFLNDNTEIREFLNDNTDNRNNMKNGRNCGCHEVTYNTDNGITSAIEKLLLLSLLFRVYSLMCKN